MCSEECSSLEECALSSSTDSDSEEDSVSHVSVPDSGWGKLSVSPKILSISDSFPSSISVSGELSSGKFTTISATSAAVY